MSEDWLEIGTLPTERPGFSDQAIVAATDAATKRAQFVCAWEGLTDKQRVFLNTWRECRFNANRAFRVLANTTHHCSKTTVGNWAENPGFELCRTMLRAASIEEIMHRDTLIARHDDIVETLLTPKPILYQGIATGHMEVEASAAARANADLMKAAGLLKDKELEINVGLVGPSLNIQVVQSDGTVREIASQGVAVELAEPAIDAEFSEVAEDDTSWIDGP